MFFLKEAPLSVRKTAAYVGVWSGKFQVETDGTIIVYNHNHPDGIKVTKEHAKFAKDMTWKEIRRRIWVSKRYPSYSKLTIKSKRGKYPLISF